jgi:hypothetical protein
MLHFTRELPKPFRPKDSLTIYIDGCKTGNSYDFLKKLYDELKCPAETITYNGLIDWLRDLSWIPQKHIVILIENFSMCMAETPDFKEYFIEDMAHVVDPFWMYEARAIYPPEQMKEIQVWCLF